MSFLKKLFRNYLLLSAVCIILGIALIADPEFFTAAISYTIGGISIAAGAGSIIRYFARGEERGEYASDLFRGLVLAAIGIFLIVKPDFIFKVFAFGFGFYMLFSGFVSLGDSLDIRRADGSWVLSCVLAAATAVLGLVIILNPLAPVNIAVRILGIALAVSGATNLIGCLSGKRQLKSLKKEIKKAVKDGSKDYIDID